MLLSNMYQQELCQSNATYMPYVQSTQCTSLAASIQIYATYELNGLNHLARSTVPTTITQRINITLVCQWPNQPKRRIFYEAATILI